MGIAQVTKTFGQRLFELREDKGLAQKELAARVIRDMAAVTGDRERRQEMRAGREATLRRDLAHLDAEIRRNEADRRKVARAILDEVFIGDQARQANRDVEDERLALEVKRSAVLAELAEVEAEGTRVQELPGNVALLASGTLSSPEIRAILQAVVRGRIVVKPSQPEPLYE